MSRFGVDYSYARPSVSALKSAGVTFAIRYTSYNPDKNMTPDEVKALNDAGIDVVTNWESTKGFMLNGYQEGVDCAREALKQAFACGMPHDRPVYFSLDVDPRNLTPGQWSQVDAFLDGASSVLGRQNVGIYGGLLAVQRVLNTGRATWAWQTYGWSAGLWDTRAHIQQYLNGQKIDGADVDYCRAITPDFGQWNVNNTKDWFDMATKDDLQAVVRAEVLRAVQWLGGRTNIVYNNNNEALDNVSNLPSVRADITGVRTVVDQIVVTSTDLIALADAILEKLTPELATALVNELLKRLSVVTV